MAAVTAMVPNLGKIPRFAAQLQDYDRHPPRPLTAADREILEGILRDVSSINPMTPQIQKSLSLRAHLEIIVGDYPTVKHEYHFPDPFPDRAVAVIEKFEEIRWGAPEDVEDDEVPTSPTSTTSAMSATSSSAGKQRSLPRASSPTVRAEKTLPKLPRPDHPIFGTRGIMRGIVINNNLVRSYALDGRYSALNSNVIGHNKLSVGDWWPLQICALRDGAHGARISGIAGSKANGAFSIVISGHYEHLDADRGDTLYYSSSQALQNEDPENPIISMHTEAMRLSFRYRRPLRVLRCSRSSSPYSPSQGIRYDGLYTITGEETVLNTRGGAYIRFRLERDHDQAAMDLKRPTPQEKRLCEQVREGY
ncbi:hypothetical protein MMC07_004924 [Pseudocyphellaria aurata]|nr:hypothetical protein [Pseudocyphellaria aurata]